MIIWNCIPWIKSKRFARKLSEKLSMLLTACPKCCGGKISLASIVFGTHTAFCLYRLHWSRCESVQWLLSILTSTRNVLEKRHRILRYWEICQISTPSWKKSEQEDRRHANIVVSVTSWTLSYSNRKFSWLYSVACDDRFNLNWIFHRKNLIGSSAKPSIFIIESIEKISHLHSMLLFAVRSRLRL